MTHQRLQTSCNGTDGCKQDPLSLIRCVRGPLSCVDICHRLILFWDEFLHARSVSSRDGLDSFPPGRRDFPFGTRTFGRARDPAIAVTDDGQHVFYLDEGRLGRCSRGRGGRRAEAGESARCRKADGRSGKGRGGRAGRDVLDDGRFNVSRFTIIFIEVRGFSVRSVVMRVYLVVCVVTGRSSTV